MSIGKLHKNAKNEKNFYTQKNGLKKHGKSRAFAFFDLMWENMATIYCDEN